MGSEAAEKVTFAIAEDGLVQMLPLPEPEKKAPEEKVPEQQEPLVLEPDVLTEPDLSAGPEAPHFLTLPPPDEKNRPPAWWPNSALPPKGFKFPRGYRVIFFRLRASLTNAMHKGDRHLIIWEVSDGDERLAYMRAMADLNRASGEVAKQMIRFVDGHEVDWSGNPGPGNVDTLWRDAGAKGRNLLIRLHTQLHVLDRAEMQDFLGNCLGLVHTV